MRTILAAVVLLQVSVLGLPLNGDSSLDPLSTSGHCAHKFPSVNDLPHPVHLSRTLQVGGVNRRDKRDAEIGTEEVKGAGKIENQLRIKVFYHDSVKMNISARQREIVMDQVVPDAVSFWSRVLKVRAASGPILLNRKCENNQFFLAPGDPTQYCRNQCVETKCGEVNVPASHLKSCNTCDEDGRSCGLRSEDGEGIPDVDFVLYVSALSTPQCGETIGGEASTVAYAAHCQQEAEFDRPVAGHTNICPAAIKDSKTHIDGLSGTIKHELLHALGFSSSLFAFFRAPDGSPLTERGEDGMPAINQRLQIRQWSDKIIKTVTRPWEIRGGTINRKFYLMVTPRVVEEVRRQFNCSDLEGAELEDQGGDGTALTHWEKRLFQNEAMTGTVHTQNPVYSRLTFALLEDSGWYKPNYDLAQHLNWGYNLGCDFARKSCKELMELQETSPEHSGLPFCNKIMQSSPRTECTADGVSVGSCNLVQFGSSLPQMYRNFDQVDGVDKADVNMVGSSVTLADFCPYVQEFTWKSSAEGKERGTRCTSIENHPAGDGNYALETYNTGSRCFRQGRQWTQKSCNLLKQWQRFGAGCYPFSCPADGRLHIQVGANVSLPCDFQGQELDVSLLVGEWLHQGSIICPACSYFCSSCSPSVSDNETDSEEAEDRTVDRVYEADSMKENLTDTCFDQSDRLQGFLSNFGIDLG